MPGDVASSNDDELLNQIDELKARMDRLMRGGTSTSNSALLTDTPKQKAPPVGDAEPSPVPPPPRTRVRDLIGPQDTETVEPLPSQPDVVPFPAETDSADEDRPSDRRVEDRPSSPPPPSKPKPAVEGSLISVDEGRAEPRPQVASFDQLGSAIEEELARDASVPPASLRKGPDLASRFGAGDDPAESEAKPVEAVAPVVEEEADVDDELAESAVEEDFFEETETQAGRSHVGAVVAIWVFTAVTSGTIATLHFTGII